MARGNIRKRSRKDGSDAYMVRVEMPADPRTGKRLSRVGTFDTRKEADKALTAWLAELDRGIVSEPTKLTIADLLSRWLDDEVAPGVRANTLVTYRTTVERHLIPRLGAGPRLS